MVIRYIFDNTTQGQETPLRPYVLLALEKPIFEKLNLQNHNIFYKIFLKKQKNIMNKQVTWLLYFFNFSHWQSGFMKTAYSV